MPPSKTARKKGRILHPIKEPCGYAVSDDFSSSVDNSTGTSSKGMGDVNKRGACRKNTGLLGPRVRKERNRTILKWDSSDPEG